MEIKQFSDLQNIEPEQYPEHIRQNLLKAKRDAINLPDSIQTLIFFAPNNQFLLEWSSLTIGSDSTNILIDPDLAPFQARICYKNSQFILQNYVTDNFQILRKLDMHECVYINPGRCIKLGDVMLETAFHNIGSFSETGMRLQNEDTHVCIHNLFVFEHIPVAFYGIYDGHGGNICSEFLKVRLHVILRRCIMKHPQRYTNVMKAVYESLIEAFSQVDQEYIQQHPEHGRNQGSAAIVCLVIGDRVVCANLGDSRAILCREGMALPLSNDHSPQNPIEEQRINESGGFVAFGRLMGKLGISRSFGDFQYKHIDIEELQIEVSNGPMLSARPDIRTTFLHPNNDEFLLLGCDGLFNVFGNQEVVEIIREKLKRLPIMEQNPLRVIREIVNCAIYERRSKDNVTAMLVTLKSGIGY